LNKHKYCYKIAFSFADEQRSKVVKVVKILEKNNLSIFYDKNEEIHILGKNIPAYLRDVYLNKSEFIVMCISREYSEKRWPLFESDIIQERMVINRTFNTGHEFLWPIRFDDTELPGLSKMIGYIDAKNIPEEKVAEILLEKVKLESVKSVDQIIETEKYENVDELLIKIIEELKSLIKKLFGNKFEIQEKKDENSYVLMFSQNSKLKYFLMLTLGGQSGARNKFLIYDNIYEPKNYVNIFNAEIIMNNDQSETKLTAMNYGFFENTAIRFKTSSDSIIQNIIDKLSKTIQEY